MPQTSSHHVITVDDFFNSLSPKTKRLIYKQLNKDHPHYWRPWDFEGLCSQTPEDLLAIHGFGAVRLKEVENSLAKIGFCLSGRETPKAAEYVDGSQCAVCGCNNVPTRFVRGQNSDRFRHAMRKLHRRCAYCCESSVGIELELIPNLAATKEIYFQVGRMVASGLNLLEKRLKESFRTEKPKSKQKRKR